MLSSRNVSLAALMLAGVATAPAGTAQAQDSEDTTGCIQATDAVAGDLRKVVSRRPSNGKLITNWHLLTAEPLCIVIDGNPARNVTDIQVVFARGVDLKAMDQSLGTAVGVRGTMIYPPDDSYTGGVVVMNATTDVELDDAGSVKQ